MKNRAIAFSDFPYPGSCRLVPLIPCPAQTLSCGRPDLNRRLPICGDYFPDLPRVQAAVTVASHFASVAEIYPTSIDPAFFPFA